MIESDTGYIVTNTGRCYVEHTRTMMFSPGASKDEAEAIGKALASIYVGQGRAFKVEEVPVADQIKNRKLRLIMNCSCDSSD